MKPPQYPALALAEKTAMLTSLAGPEIQRLEPNVLRLDYVDVTAGGQIRTNLHFYQA